MRDVARTFLGPCAALRAWHGNMRTAAGTLALAFVSLLAAPACKRASADPALSKTAKPAPEKDEGIPNVPVPAEGGPRLWALRSDVPVLEKPKKDARTLGALRFGGSVARAEKAYKETEECPGGYYPVRPRGFVCAGADVSLDG